MADTLRSRQAEIVAVGSERPGAAQEFAAEWEIGNALDSHRAVATLDDVDVVYVATTNDRHAQNALDCIAAGTPVLCEKPLTINARQARAVFEAARSAGVFAMEAMWMRFLPFVERLDQIIADGKIGDIRHISATFGYQATTDPARRWMNRDLGGGSLLDLGIYPLTLIHHLVGSPTSFEASAYLASTGVDTDVNVTSQHRNGVSALMTSTFTAQTANEATVAGTDGLIRIHAPFHHSPRLTVERREDAPETHDTSFDGHGFRFQVEETERCVGEGLVESPLRQHRDTLAVLEWMDAIRSRCGIEYPADEL